MPKPLKNQEKGPLGKLVELAANDWARSERFVQDFAKADAQHHAAKAKTRPVSKGRIHKGKTRA